MTLGDQYFRKKQLITKAVNATATLNKILPIVSPNMHKTRRNALSACILSLAQGNLCTVTSIGRGIQSKTYEKHRIKRSDRLLSNPNLRREALSIYAYICRLFVIQARPIISADGLMHFLIRASTAFEGRSITLYEEASTSQFHIIHFQTFPS